MRQQPHFDFIEKVNSSCCCVRTGIVMMKKEAAESRLWTALAPNFKDLRETVMHVPVRGDSHSVLKTNGGDMAQFSEETDNYFLLCAA